MYNRRWHKGVCAMTSLQQCLSVEMGSMFIITCCSTERQNQFQAVTRHTQQVVSDCRDTLSDQLEPDAAAGGGGGVLLIP